MNEVELLEFMKVLSVDTHKTQSDQESIKKVVTMLAEVVALLVEKAEPDMSEEDRQAARNRLVSIAWATGMIEPPEEAIDFINRRRKEKESAS